MKNRVHKYWPIFTLFLAVCAALLPAINASALAQAKDAGGLNYRDVQAGRVDQPVPLKSNSMRRLVEEQAATTRLRSASPQFTNGNETNGFPYVARIDFVGQNGSPATCSGYFLQKLISKDSRPTSEALKDDHDHNHFSFLVLTAAHCSCGRLESYRFRLKLDKNGEPRPTGFTNFVPLQAPDRYRGYSCGRRLEQQAGKDLALFRVRFMDDRHLIENSNVYENSVSPYLRLGRMQDVFTDVLTIRLTGVGYGFDEFGELAPDSPREAFIPIASYFCGRGYFARSTCAPFREFVLAERSISQNNPRADSCGGDSGAPIFWQIPPNKNSTNSYLHIALVGIVSRAVVGVRHDSPRLCGGGGIYTSLGHPEVIKWLNQNGVDTFTIHQTFNGGNDNQ